MSTLARLVGLERERRTSKADGWVRIIIDEDEDEDDDETEASAGFAALIAEGRRNVIVVRIISPTHQPASAIGEDEDIEALRQQSGAL